MNCAFILLNIWMGLKIILAGFVSIAATTWGRDTQLDALIVPILIFVTSVQILLMIYDIIRNRRHPKNKNCPFER